MLLPFLAFFSCKKTSSPVIELGVSKALADERKKQISDIQYQLTFSIPNQIDEKITGVNKVTFHLKSVATDLQLDFKNAASSVESISIENMEIESNVTNEHIVIPKTCLTTGVNEIIIKFKAGEQALNRNEDYLYTLFVPDKASTAFPCFDQPNLKATYDLSLNVPNEWVAIANYPLSDKIELEKSSTWKFEQTLPISTYLFAFAAGRFENITETLDGLTMTLYHRETDSTKVKNNTFTIFDLHAKSIRWLESYTGIPQPFKKFDFVLLPAFQFGGMEHPGAIFYKARSLFLEGNATVNQELSRNALIAHETAHMWFGNLVTMDWFNDVWLKEVFANFMAAKMVNPNFPDINHDLRFLHRHQPAAYTEDRTKGTHPIQQQLENLNEASLMYGRIIYQKAPVVMNQFESAIGESNFQKGLQDYLKTFSFGNATWDDLIKILDGYTDSDLKLWSQAWVKEAGMPHIKAELDTINGKISNYKLSIQNETSGGNIWHQHTKLLYAKDGKMNFLNLNLNKNETIVNELLNKELPDFILPNVSKDGYGFFEVDQRSQQFLLDNIQLIDDSFTKFTAWLSLWEGMLRQQISTRQIMQTILEGLSHEKELLGFSSRLNYLKTIFWGFTGGKKRTEHYPDIENDLWQLMEAESDRDRKKLLYDAFVNVAMADSAVQVMHQIWTKEKQIPGLELSENDFTTLAYELAIRDFPDSGSILNQQKERISNPDRQAEMEFIIPAISEKLSERDAFFESLKSYDNREKEPWVLRALEYLHHPLRAKAAEKYILPSLDLVRAIQQTNTIFFPKRWISTILNGHQSKEAAQVVNDFVNNLPQSYPYKLKNKILQAADLLDRKAVTQ